MHRLRFLRLKEEVTKREEMSTVRTIREILRQALGGCPKRNVCSFEDSKSKTCIHGPYQYCGQYRNLNSKYRKTNENKTSKIQPIN